MENSVFRSIMAYGAQILGFQEFKQVEALQVRFIKEIIRKGGSLGDVPRN